ncbi:MAG: hypothetical protein ACK5V9_05675 [Burkholderiales bacterium]|jgi:hypothetical protein
MLRILSIEYDARLRATCINASANFSWYLEKVQGAEDNLSIQRGIIGGSKSYATLRADLKRGCLLPPIVIAAKSLNLPPDVNLDLKEGRCEVIEEAVILNAVTNVTSQNVYIIDGLQRTNAIRQTLEEITDEDEKMKFLSRNTRLEIWLEIPFSALAYRMLVLNAGQKPMSIKHQIEILSMKLQEELSTIDGIDIFSSLEPRRRTRGGQFQLAKLAQAFQAWLQGQPNVDLRNAVMEQMLADTAIETLGASLESDGPQIANDGFHRLVQWIVSIDLAMPEDTNSFFGNETVLLGLAAAVGSSERNPQLKERVWSCLQNIGQSYRQNPMSDHLSVRQFDDLRKGIDVSTRNVGQATRDMVFRAFQEHFFSNGLKPMTDCWTFAAG